MAETEIKEYQGQRLDSFERAYDNSIRGPQQVDLKTYRLKIGGLVEEPIELTYEQVLALPQEKRLITLYCVEGWNEKLLYEGVRLADLLTLARPKEGVKTVIFQAVDGYTSSLEYGFVKEKDPLLAFRINGRVLDEKRGFPFQVVATDKLGYKWVRWLERIELSNEDYQGYWESRGYDNQADVKPSD